MPKTDAQKAPRWRRWLLEALIFIAGALALQWWQTRHAPHGPVPEFAAHTSTGQPFVLSTWRQAQAGQASLIYFWADWCGICKTTAGNVAAVSQDWPVVTIASQSGGASDVAKVVQSRHYTWPITLADPEARILAQFGFQGVPGFVIVDPAGRISSVTLGYTSELGLRLRLWWAGLALA